MNNFKIILITLFLLGGIGIVLYLNRYSVFSRYLSLKLTACEFESGDGNQLKYRLYNPNLKEGETYPLVIYLHGGSQGGDNNLKQLDKIVDFYTSGKVQKEHPSFVIAPQCPSGREWINITFKSFPLDHYDQSKLTESPQFVMLVKLIEQLSQNFPIDKSRVYMIGFSMGSSGTWDFITRHPDLIAAAVPISGISDTSTVNKILNIPIWAFHGENDDIAPVRLNKNMSELINKAGGNCKLTIFEKKGHGCITEAINYPGLTDWIFSQQKNISNAKAQ